MKAKLISCLSVLQYFYLKVLNLTVHSSDLVLTAHIDSLGSNQVMVDYIKGVRKIKKQCVIVQKASIYIYQPIVSRV